MRTVTAYKAKKEFSELLEAAEQGESITNTKHGMPVAMLVPHAVAQRPDPGQLIEEWRRGNDPGADRGRARLMPFAPHSVLSPHHSSLVRAGRSR